MAWERHRPGGFRLHSILRPERMPPGVYSQQRPPGRKRSQAACATGGQTPFVAEHYWLEVSLLPGTGSQTKSNQIKPKTLPEFRDANSLRPASEARPLEMGL